ncbi:uncharacterized protein LOC120334142 [Styela clava]
MSCSIENAYVTCENPSFRRQDNALPEPDPENIYGNVDPYPQNNDPVVTIQGAPSLTTRKKQGISKRILVLVGMFALLLILAIGSLVLAIQAITKLEEAKSDIAFLKIVDSQHNDDLQKTALNFSNEIDALAAAKQKLKETAQNFSREFDALATADQRLQERVQNFSKEIDALAATDQKFQKTAQNLSQEIELLHDANSDLKEDLQKTVNNLTLADSKLEKSIQEDVKNISDINQLEDSVRNLNKSLGGLKKAVNINVVRLFGSSSKNIGTVGIFKYGEWGTVCDDSWDINDANVICRMLGFNRATAAPGAAKYGQGTGSIFMDDVNCIGTEDNIWSCPHIDESRENCAHSEDAGVACV